MESAPRGMNQGVRAGIYQARGPLVPTWPCSSPCFRPGPAGHSGFSSLADLICSQPDSPDSTLPTQTYCPPWFPHGPGRSAQLSSWGITQTTSHYLDLGFGSRVVDENETFSGEKRFVSLLSDESPRIQFPRTDPGLFRWFVSSPGQFHFGKN